MIARLSHHTHLWHIWGLSGAVVFLLSIWLFAGASEPLTVFVEAVEPPPRQLILEESAPELLAAAYAIFQIDTGALIASQAATSVRSIASITKLPAAAAVRRMSWYHMPIILTASDIDTPGTAGNLAIADRYTGRELLYPLLLTSSNDAAAALERVSEGELLPAMHALAVRAEAFDTQFTDASGLSAGNRSTVADLAALTSHLWRVDQTLFTLTALPQYLAETQGWQNNSPVIDQPGYRGGKHGFTEAAGRTIVAVFDETIAGQTVTVGYVVLGSRDLTTDVATLRAFVQEHATLE